MRLSQRRRDSKSYTAIEPYCCSAAAMSWCLIFHLPATIGSCLFSVYQYPQRVHRIMAQSSRNTYRRMRDRQQLSGQRNGSSVATLRRSTAFWLEAETVPFILHDSLTAALSRHYRRPARVLGEDGLPLVLYAYHLPGGAGMSNLPVAYRQKSKCMADNTRQSTTSPTDGREESRDGLRQYCGCSVCRGITVRYYVRTHHCPPLWKPLH